MVENVRNSKQWDRVENLQRTWSQIQNKSKGYQEMRYEHRKTKPHGTVKYTKTEIPKLGRQLDSSCCSLHLWKAEVQKQSGEQSRFWALCELGPSLSTQGASTWQIRGRGLFLGCSLWVSGELNTEYWANAADLGKGIAWLRWSVSVTPELSHCKPAWGRVPGWLWTPDPNPPTQGAALSSFQQSL